LYEVLKDKVSCFITLDRLKEVSHGMDTQVNESFNNTVSWLAPKNKVYCGSWSLCNRLAVAVGINTLRVRLYFCRLFVLLGIPMTPNVLYYLSQKDKHRNNQLKKIKTRDEKKKRVKRKHQQLSSPTFSVVQKL
jgi:hypothetical protein